MGRVRSETHSIWGTHEQSVYWLMFLGNFRVFPESHGAHRSACDGRKRLIHDAFRQVCVLAITTLSVTGMGSGYSHRESLSHLTFPPGYKVRLLLPYNNMTVKLANRQG